MPKQVILNSTQQGANRTTSMDDPEKQLAPIPWERIYKLYTTLAGPRIDAQPAPLDVQNSPCRGQTKENTWSKQEFEPACDNMGEKRKLLIGGFVLQFRLAAAPKMPEDVKKAQASKLR